MNNKHLVIAQLLRLFDSTRTPSTAVCFVNALERYAHGQATYAELDRCCEALENSHEPVQLYRCIAAYCLVEPNFCINHLVLSLVHDYRRHLWGHADENNEIYAYWKDRVWAAITNDCLETLPKRKWEPDNQDAQIVTDNKDTPIVYFTGDETVTYSGYRAVVLNANCMLNNHLGEMMIVMLYGYGGGNGLHVYNAVGMYFNSEHENDDLHLVPIDRRTLKTVELTPGLGKAGVQRCRLFDKSKGLWLKDKKGFFLTWTEDTKEACLLTLADAKDILLSSWFHEVVGNVVALSADYDPNELPPTATLLILSKEIPLKDL